MISDLAALVLRFASKSGVQVVRKFEGDVFHAFT